MVRRAIRIAIIGWLVGAGVQWARRTGGAVPHVQRLIRRGSRAPAATGARTGAKGRASKANEAARARLAATAAREAASARRGPAPASTTGTTVEPPAEAPAALEAGATQAAATAPAGDELRVIEGIGPRIDSVLRAAGTSTFAELAALPVERIEEILRDASVRASPGTWPEQARLAANGEWDALAELQAHLRGGREVPVDTEVSAD